MSREDASRKATDIELLTSRVLLAGVIAAATVVSIGGLLFLTSHGGDRVELSVFKGEPSNLRQPLEILRQAAAGRGRGLIQLGLLLLIGTPVLRVACSVYAFARQRDYLYVCLTLFVLAILTYSLACQH